MKRLFDIVVRGLWGRKRDSLTLSSVLVLSFLFLTLSSVLLSSVAHTSQLRREALYGGWQVMYYGAGDEAAAACAENAEMAQIRLVGNTDNGRKIGSIDASVFEMGNFTLLEGRLPEAENEILLVQGRIEDAPAVGGEILISYQYDYMKGTDRVGVYEVINQEIAKSVKVTREEMVDGELREVTWEERKARFEQFVYDAYDEDFHALMYDEQTVLFWLTPGATLEEELAQENVYENILSLWVQLYYAPENFDQTFQSPYYAPEINSLVGGLHGYEGYQINVKGSQRDLTLQGEGFSDEQRGTIITGTRQTSTAMLYKRYTVVGVMAPYADHWDVRSYEMPDAFVSETSADAQERAIDYAEQFYHENAETYHPESILLFRGDDAAIEQLLVQYNALRAPYFRMEGFYTDERQRRQGFITGLDPYTGEEKTMTLYVGNNIDDRFVIEGYGISRQLTGDPSAPSRWDEIADILLPLPPIELSMEELQADNTYPFRLNTFSYPVAGSTEESLQTLLSAILVGVAACATFQIFWVQLRRRKGRIATLISIGATDGQVLGMLLLEVLLLLLLSGVLGMALGFALAQLLLGSVVQATWHPDWEHILTGLSSGAAAVIAGAMIPMLLALRTPLTGRETASRHALRLRTVRGRMKPQRYWRIVLRNMTANRSKTVLQCTFAWLLATICLLTVFLCHNAFADYRREIEQTARPDYQLEAPYAMSKTYLANNLTGMKMEQVAVSAYTGAENVFLHCDDYLDRSPILRTLRDDEQGQSLFYTLPDGQTGFPVRVLGTETDSPFLTKLLSMLPEGTVSLEELTSGEACILLVPRYVPSGDKVQTRPVNEDTLAELERDEQSGHLLELSYDPVLVSMTQADMAIQPGDTLTLTGLVQTVSEAGVTEATQTIDTRVAAVIHVLPEAIWPYFSNSTSHVIVSGTVLVPRIYSAAGTRMTAEQAVNHRVMASIFYPDCYGKTYFTLNNVGDVDGIAQDTAAAAFGESLGLDFTNYRLQNERVYSDAVKRTMMFLLLGAEMALVVLTILSATASSSVEQERKRYGTLQALGVSGGQLWRGQVLQALGVALLALLAAHLTVALVMLVSALVTNLGLNLLGLRMTITLGEMLRTYPWQIHTCVCAGYLIVYLIAQSSPIRAVSRQDPIENIRS